MKRKIVTEAESLFTGLLRKRSLVIVRKSLTMTKSASAEVSGTSGRKFAEVDGGRLVGR